MDWPPFHSTAKSSAAHGFVKQFEREISTRQARCWAGLTRFAARSSPVIKSDASLVFRRRRQLGFPTANLDVANLILPPNGVYTAVTRLEDRSYRVALNIGVRPTVATESPLRVEAHLLDFNGELYGTELELEIGERLRGEQTFGSPEELRRQIVRDIALVRSRY